uniref:Uncharacterized protein n=1 Tax=Romanomermis culicivorax TaxID=13658 RepID=A0A915I5I9_ROMCU
MKEINRVKKIKSKVENYSNEQERIRSRGGVNHGTNLDGAETKRNLTMLFGRLTSMRQNDAEIWCLYSNLVAPVNMLAEGHTIDLDESAREPSAWEMSALYARKALNSARQKNSGWEKSNTAEAKKILSYALLYTRTQRKYLENAGNLSDSQKSTAKMTTRFAVQPILIAIKKAYLDTDIMDDILKNDYVSLENAIFNHSVQNFISKQRFS